MRNLAKLVLFLSVICTSHAEPVIIDRDELNRLYFEIQKLNDRLNRLEDKLEQSPQAVVSWGCYLKDPVAGSFYGSGKTMAEAKGKTLIKCEQRDGACRDSRIKCDSN